MLVAQVTTFPINGAPDIRDGVWAFTHATIFKAFNERIDDATLIVRNGRVMTCGRDASIPTDATVIDLKGKWIYPSFIDLYSGYGVPEAKALERNGEANPQFSSSKRGAFGWNEAIKSEFRANDVFVVGKGAEEYRALGFGVVMTHQIDGISRGTGALVALGNERENVSILRSDAAHILSFNKGVSRQDYPSSHMGAIALLRQTYLDGVWYRTSGFNEQRNVSLERWNAIQTIPQFFVVNDCHDVFRAAAIGREFGAKYIIKGNGDEYRRLAEIKSVGFPLVIPLVFPEAYDVEDPYDAEMISLADMKHWELAPSNVGKVEAAGIEFALTSQGLKNRADFLKNIRLAIENGLTEQAALRALTATPANLVGASDIIGSLEAGKMANFIITSGNVFEKDTKIFQNWIQGKPFVLAAWGDPNLNGVYNLAVNGKTYSLTIKGAATAPEATLTASGDSLKIKASFALRDNLVTLNFSPDSTKNNVLSLTGVAQGNTWTGRATLPNGKWTSWVATYSAALPTETPKPVEAPKVPQMGGVVYPFNGYGLPKVPTQGIWLIKNATIWTCEPEGIIQNGDVLIQNGHIEAVSQGMPAPAGAVVIDGTGKHVTPGIIDEHSHIAAYHSINEGTEASSSEVRIGDIIDPEDINIYRQLAGGVTCVQVLHGSANPIGGQSALIKLRWGMTAEQMKIQDADGFIKFALGENVKQANWGDDFKHRFPQTRMGVEQVYEDYFTRAREYERQISGGRPYRRDLKMDAILEILQKKRFITCHSYQQGEINMLMKVADRHGFRVNTFTHILEGYKVADKMKQHGVGAAGFSDWWDYKYEVYDAIPYNGALLYEQGVLTAFNSDDEEMARRLNQEAGKAVMYGNVPEQEALKFVTLNPAKLLHLAEKTGSIRVGKDADIVLWSAHPLSIYARAESTWIDGIQYYSVERDAALRDEMQLERARLIQKMLAAKKSGQPTQPAISAPKKLMHCEEHEHDDTE